MNKFESFAIGHYLSSWPEEMENQDILKAMREGSTDYDIWSCATYEDIPLDEVATLIEGMKEYTMVIFGAENE